ncbi:hypothetical protein CBR_g18968 [Chara braunii]|uniref:Uncharacterized protein n=1 Tax=Chara braunii TaxID=69332 RepID=A0A388KWZ3_CHABU|nr:hypothetical protein CBR_g18968 [Chara braunii]|eukprot:GBG74557.1 hypothetical protein CBR_g18968 [Chara braunii]
MIHIDHEGCGPGEEGFPGQEDVPEFHPSTGDRMVDWLRRAGKGQVLATEGLREEGPSKRKDGGADPAATRDGNRLRQQKVTEVYGGEWVACHKNAFLSWLYSSGVSFNAFRNEAWKAYQQVLLEQPGSSRRAVLPSHGEIASIQAVETHRAELAEELEEGMMRGDDSRAFASIPWSADVCIMARWVRRQIRWDPWWQRVTTIVHIMELVMQLLRRMDRGGQFISLTVEWAHDFVHRVKDACAPLGQSFADWIIRRVQTRTHHMLEPAHCAGFLLSPRRRHVRYFSGEVEGYHAWLASQAKRYILTQTGFELDGVDYIVAYRQVEDFRMQQGLEVESVRTGMRKGMTQEEIAQQVALITRDLIGASAPPSADAVFDRRACIFRPYPRDDDSDEERAPEAADDPALPIPPEIDETHEDTDDEETRTYTARQATNRAKREMMGGGEDYLGRFGEVASTSDVRDDKVGGSHVGTSRAEVGIRTPTPTRLRSPSPGVLQEEVGHRATLADRGGAARAEEEVTTATMVEGEVAAMEEEVLTVATRDEEVPVGATVEGEIPVAVVGKEEVALAAVVSKVDMEHDGADATRGGDDAEEHLMQQFITEELDPVVGGFIPGVARGLGMSPWTGWGGSEMGTHFDFDISMGAPPTCSGAASTDRAPSRDEATGEMGHRETGRDGGQGGVVAGPDVMEGVEAEATDEAVEGRPQVVDEAVEGGHGRDGGAGDARPVDHEIVTGPVVLFSGLHLAEARRSQPTELAVHDVPLVIITDLGSESMVVPPRPRRPAKQEADYVDLDSTRRVTELTARLQPSLGTRGARTTGAREVAATGCEPQRGRGDGVSTSTLDHALRAATRAVHEQTPRQRGVPHPRLVPTEGGTALGDSSGAKRLGTPRGSRRQDTVAQASTRVVLVRKGGGLVTIEEDDPETAPTVWE